MEDVLEEVVSSDDLKRFERIYHDLLHSSGVTQKAQFEYAWCLVRSKYPADIRKGIILLEDLYCNHSDSERRDCLYYLAIGNARIKEYTKALSYVRSFLQIEPGNQQVQHLETLISKKMEKGFLFINYYWLRQIKIIIHSSSMLLQSACSMNKSFYFLLFFVTVIFSWVGSHYIYFS